MGFTSCPKEVRVCLFSDGQGYLYFVYWGHRDLILLGERVKMKVGLGLCEATCLRAGYLKKSKASMIEALHFVAGGIVQIAWPTMSKVALISMCLLPLAY